LKLPANCGVHYPTKLPPLRPDAPTLIIGRMKAAKELAVSVSGSVAAVTVTRNVPVLTCPSLEVAVTVTVVVPTGNEEPDVWL